VAPRAPTDPPGETKTIAGRYLIGRDRLLAPGRLSYAGGRILETRPIPEEETLAALRSESCVPWILPGLIELQVNGFAGIDLQTAGAEELHDLGRHLAREGVAAFLPTLITAPIPALCDRLRTFRDGLADRPPDAAEVLGFHLEGPFLSPEKPGVHDPSLMLDPERGLLEELQDAAGGGIRLMTFAPELDGALDCIAHCATLGIVPALGHTAASYTRCKEAIDAGARFATHLGNAMPPLKARDPGPVGACLEDPLVTVGLIADLVHGDAGFLRTVWKAKGPRRIALTTDAVAAAGLPNGEHHLGGLEVRSEAGVVRDREGRLAGSALRPAHGLANFAQATGAGPLALARIGATNAAELLGLGDERGALEPGLRSDLAAWQDLEGPQPRLLALRLLDREPPVSG